MAAKYGRPSKTATTRCIICLEQTELSYKDQRICSDACLFIHTEMPETAKRIINNRSEYYGRRIYER
jgi:hypothetical protein